MLAPLAGIAFAAALVAGCGATDAGDCSAECIADADEGVEHLWRVTVGPAGAGLEVEIDHPS